MRKEIPSLRSGGSNTGSALFGVLAVSVGTLLSIANVPGDVQPAGALFWSAFLASCGLLSVPLSRIGRDISLVLKTENVLMVGLVYWLLLDLLQGSYPLHGVSRDDVVMAFIAIGMMAAGIGIGMTGRGWRLPGVVVWTVSRSIHDKALFKAVIWAFALGMFYFAAKSDFDLQNMWEGLGKGRFSASWTRDRLGGWDAFMEHLVYFGYVLPALTVVLAHNKGWARPQVIISLVLSLIMVVFLAQGGGRRIVGVVVGAALVAWMLLQARVTTRLVVGAAVAIGLLLGTMEMMLQYRNVGYAPLLEGKAPSVKYAYLHVDDNFLRLSQTINLFPERHPYVLLDPVFYTMMRPIPRVFWPNKPTGPGYDLPQLVGVRDASLSSSLVGELYACYGLLAVFFGGWLLGRLGNMWNRVLELTGDKTKALVYGLGLMTLFAGFRSMQEFVLMSYGLLGWFIIVRIVARRRVKTPIKGIQQ